MRRCYVSEIRGRSFAKALYTHELFAGVKFDVYNQQRLAKTKLWSLEDRRTRADLIEVYKIIHGLSTVRFSTFFERSHNERTRGHSLKLHKNVLGL